jgi:hypothetical protein
MMKFSAVILLMLALALLSSAGQALETFSGEIVSIDSPVNDDVFAAGNIVNINAPVDSAVVAGGTVNVNAPIKGDLFAAGGQVYVNADVGGKVVAAGGTLSQGGNVGTNLVAAGGQVNILSSSEIARDALITGGNVVNSGQINGTLTVSANSLQNRGTASKVDFYQTERREKERPEQPLDRFNIFTALMIIGYFILGLILVRILPGIFTVVDGEIMASPVVRTIVGFVTLIASFIAILLVAITVVGLPIAGLSLLLVAAAMMLSGTFVSFSLGQWIGRSVKISQSNLVFFTIGFVILNVLFLVPYLGALVSFIALSLGFGGIIYAAHQAMSGQKETPSD